MAGENGQQTAADGATQTAELSLRDEIVKNMADLKAEATDETTASKLATTPEKPQTPPAEKPAAQTPEKPAASTETTQTPPADAKAKAPQSWSAAERAHWDKIPPEVQAVINRREEEAHRGITTLGQDAAFGKKINEVVTPYMPMIRSEGGDAASAVQSLLQTAYVLRTANAEQKVGLFRQLAGQFGVDLSAAAQGAQQLSPEVQSLRQELAQLRGHIASGEQQQHQHIQVQAQSVIEAFAADPKNEFYEQVKPLMGQLLVGGQARDMQEAYDMACHAIPDVRSTILSRQTAEAEAKRAAEAKAKADAKRRAAGSVSGSPGSPVTTATTADPNRSLRDELRANYRAATSPS